MAHSFSINRFASFTIEFEHKTDVEALKAEYLYGLVDRATNRKVFVPRAEWEARSVFFILAQWLFLSDRRAVVPSLEEHILAILLADRIREARRGRLRDDQGWSVNWRCLQDAGLVPEDARRSTADALTRW